MPTIKSLTATIARSSSLSTIVDVGGNYVVGIIMPDIWTEARVSVQVSPDGVIFHDLFDFNFGELIFSATNGVAIAVDHRRLLMARYIKLRSGTRGAPINQGATCAFTVIAVDMIGGATPKGSE